MFCRFKFVLQLFCAVSNKVAEQFSCTCACKLCLSTQGHTRGSLIYFSLRVERQLSLVYIFQGPQETITCEGEKEWIECPQYKVIKINSAFWGRDDAATCTTNGVQHGLITSKMCPQDESNTMTKVEGQCKDERACELAATSTFFDKTDCGEVYKYLRVSYDCLPSESRVKAAIQRSRISG